MEQKVEALAKATVGNRIWLHKRWWKDRSERHSEIPNKRQGMMRVWGDERRQQQRGLKL